MESRTNKTQKLREILNVKKDMKGYKFNKRMEGKDDEGTVKKVLKRKKETERYKH